VRNDPQEGDRVVERKIGHAGTVVEWEEHDPSTVYVLSAPQLGAQAEADLRVDRRVYDDAEKS